jgi:hypothetical protein
MSDIERSRRRLPRPATVLSGVAVFAVLAGTATAASTVINGKQIKRGTVTGKQIKNKSLALNDLSKGAGRRSGRGRPGGREGRRRRAGPGGHRGTPVRRG